MLTKLIDIAAEANRIIREIYETGSFDVTLKGDSSPITAADEASHRFVTGALRDLFPQPVVSEEDLEKLSPSEELWLVDPLDGTKDFVARNGEFTVNIALVRSGRPVLGVIGIPASGTIYYASEGDGAFRCSGEDRTPHKIFNRRTGPATTGLESRFHQSEMTLALYKERSIHEVLTFGSSIKHCMLAEGQADIYVRYVGTYEWDTAAGHAILSEAGCEMLDLDTGEPLRYGKPGFRNGGIVAGRLSLVSDLTSRARSNPL